MRSAKRSRKLGTESREHHARNTWIKHEGACIVCGLLFPELHHLNHGGFNRGHRFTIGLCPWHHRGHIDMSLIDAGYRKAKMREEFGPSLYWHPDDFIEEYGTDDELLEQQDAEAGYQDDYVYEHRRALVVLA